MSALIILLVLAIWSGLLYHAGYYAGFAIGQRWIRQALGVAVVISVTTLVFWDEIQGAKEFEALCNSAKGFEIAPNTSGKKFNLEVSSSDGVILVGNIRPIREYVVKFNDRATGKLVAYGKGYSAQGGRLVRMLGKHPINGGQSALFGKTDCSPYSQSAEAHKRINSLDINVNTKN